MVDRNHPRDNEADQDYAQGAQQVRRQDARVNLHQLLPLNGRWERIGPRPRNLAIQMQAQ